MRGDITLGTRPNTGSSFSKRQYADRDSLNPAITEIARLTQVLTLACAPGSYMSYGLLSHLEAVVHFRNVP